MSDEPKDERLMELLNALYANIVQYAREDMIAEAEKNFYSTRDYALGDTVACNPATALDNCQQIRAYFTPGTPKSVFENLDHVIAEINRLEQVGKPFWAGKLWIVIILATVGYFIYFVCTHR